VRVARSYPAVNILNVFKVSNDECHEIGRHLWRLTEGHDLLAAGRLSIPRARASASISCEASTIGSCSNFVLVLDHRVREHRVASRNHERDLVWHVGLGGESTGAKRRT